LRHQRRRRSPSVRELPSGIVAGPHWWAVGAEPVRAVLLQVGDAFGFGHGADCGLGFGHGLSLELVLEVLEVLKRRCLALSQVLCELRSLSTLLN
jgi:hypothetical protein